MHELSLAESMRDLIIEQGRNSGFKEVKEVTIEIGELSHVESSAMTFCFESVMAGSPAEHANLRIITQAGLGECRACGKTSTIEFRYEPCTFCGAFGLNVVAGDTVRLVSLDVK